MTQIFSYIDTSGQGNVIEMKEEYGLVSRAAYDLVVKERDEARLLSLKQSEMIEALRNAESQLRDLCDELIDHLRYNKAESDENLNEFWGKFGSIKHVAATPSACLAQHDAEVGRRGFISGFNTCYNYEGDLHLVDLANNYAAAIMRGE